MVAVGAVELARLHREEFQALVDATHVDLRHYGPDGHEVAQGGATQVDPAAAAAAAQPALPRLQGNSVRCAVPPEDCAIGSFEVGCTLGMGAFGRVFLVKYKRTGDYFAMKTMAKSNVLRQGQEGHIKEEKENFVLCASPFIVNVHGTFQDARTLYMLMDFEQGGKHHMWP